MPRVVGGREVTAVMAEKGGSEAHGEYEKTGDHDEDCNKKINIDKQRYHRNTA